MKTKLFTLALLLLSVAAGAQATATGSAAVQAAAGRSSCSFVQLWENGPMWATFNVGATITDYANLTVGIDDTPFENIPAQASPYYNTANVGGLYVWNQPEYNGRMVTWDDEVTTSVADIATSLWGDNWKTPTYAQLDSLYSGSYGKTTWSWCDGESTQYVEGCTLRGYKVSGVGAYADQSIFMPAAGGFDYVPGKVVYAAREGKYWSATPFESGFAHAMWFDRSEGEVSYASFGTGQSVRAVLAEGAVTTGVHAVAQQSAVTKSIRDGQLVITRDGKLYSVMGMEL